MPANVFEDETLVVPMLADDASALDPVGNGNKDWWRTG
jgi:hypothetical protein